MPAALAWRLVSNVRAGLVITGTELLSGLITDRNGPWLARRLGELGVEVAHVICVGDRPADLAAALHFLADQGVDLIVTSGGLGPTADDLTTEVVATFAGVELELDEAMEQQIAAILARFRHLSAFDAEGLRAANRKQAMVPQGATPLDPVGTTPGLVVPVEGGPVVIQAAERFVRCFADAVEGIRAREQVVRYEPLGVRMEADGVITAGQDHPRHAGASCGFQHSVGTVDVDVQDPGPVGLRGDSTEMDDGIDVLHGVFYCVEIGNIRPYRLDSFAGLRVGHRCDVEQP